MSVKDKLYDFFELISSYFRKIFSDENVNESVSLLESILTQEVSLEDEENPVTQDDKVNVSKRTLLSRLYVLKQEIEVFHFDFPAEYQKFMGEIEEVERVYESNLEKSNQSMTFEIDPELDSNMIIQVDRIDKSVKKFINNQLKYRILSRRLQKLIVKLNILYNISILHNKDNEKRKVISQVERAIASEIELAKEFKECDYILYDSHLKDRLVTLISYSDYQIFKTSLRNSEQSPQEVLNKLVLTSEFDEFNYGEAFIAFVQDELSDASELIAFISKEEYRQKFENDLKKLLEGITYSEESENKLMDMRFWNDYFSFESGILEILKLNGVDKDLARIKLLARMDITVSDSDVLTLPKTNAYLSLTNVFSNTQDERVLILIKLFQNLSDNITYKDIYFLILLFDLIEVMKRNSNNLIRYIQKYIDKYNYDRKTIEYKKEYVSNSSVEKKYVYAFELDDEEQIIVDTLKNLNIDFKVEDNKLFINSFYFNGLDNVLNSLLTNTIHTV